MIDMGVLTEDELVLTQYGPFDEKQERNSHTQSKLLF